MEVGRSVEVRSDFGEFGQEGLAPLGRRLSQHHAALRPDVRGERVLPPVFFFNLPQPPQNPQPSTFSPPHALLSRTSSTDVALLGPIARSRLQQLPDMVL